MAAGDRVAIEVGDGFRLDRIGPGDRAALVEHMNDPEARFVVRDPGGRLIGAIGNVGEPGPDSCRLEIGYWLARVFRGQGLMPRVLRAYASHAFGALGLHRLHAHPFTFNLASQRALEKAGFVREDHLRQHYRKNGVYLDAFVYGLLAPERSDEGS